MMLLDENPHSLLSRPGLFSIQVQEGGLEGCRAPRLYSFRAADDLPATAENAVR
jgi:hypothetical protein